MESPFPSHLLSAPRPSGFPLPLPPFFVLLQSTSFPRYYLFLTGLNKAAPKEETHDSASETLPDQALRKEIRWGCERWRLEKTHRILSATSPIPTLWRHSFLESKERHLSQEKTKWWESE